MPRAVRVSLPGRPEASVAGQRALERRTHRTADQVISTNESYRQIAITRSGKRASEVTVVRTGPDPQRLRRGEPRPELRRGRAHLAAYIGVMGPQDGVDIVVRAAAFVVHELHRTDIAFTLIGSGDCFDGLMALRDELNFAGHVEFTGRAPDELVVDILSTADVGLSPDPKNPLNDLSTMNKTMEYMAFRLPLWLPSTCARLASRLAMPRSTSYRTRYLPTLRRLSTHAGVDEAQRSLMGKLGRARVEQELAWSYQEHVYLDVYHRLLGGGERSAETGG